MKKLLYGVGINDADYVVSKGSRGKSVKCPVYMAWAGMITRCYSENYKSKRPTYANCKVEKEWHLFSNFKAWMESQDWHGKQLDKDLLFIGNKLYSPSTCLLVDAMVNSFIIENGVNGSESLIGAYWHKRDKKFSVRCRNPLTKKKEHVGLFNCPEEAHLAWRKRKHEIACQLAELQTDDRVAEALRNRYKTTVQRQLTE